MFIAMNRFQIVKGREADFEAVWTGRKSHLEGVPGFVGFALLRGPEEADHTLYTSHSTWASRDAFEAWTKSESFRAAHRNAGDSTGLHLGPPKLELYQAVEGA
ncbi:MAG: antibiotic biosynthesis monooxygenase [Pseudomonadota bacterium]